MSKTKKILVCPLDWGLGHATRCIPVIRELLNQNCEVILGGNGKSLLLLREEFPHLKWILIPGCRMFYAREPFLFMFLIFQMPFFLISLIREYFLLNKIQKKEKFDIVISDNRYGLHCKNCTSVFITHQLFIILPVWLKIFEKTAQRLVHFSVRQFDYCWIPDLPGNKNLSGILSHNNFAVKNHRFIGFLSRFSPSEEYFNATPLYEIVAVVSGPEPQRSRFENILLRQLKLTGKKSLLICGLPGEIRNTRRFENIEIVNHLTAQEFERVIKGARYLICRSGYSTVMDLVVLKKTALLVATHGQTEQEYLAGYLSDNGIFPGMSQKSFDIIEAMDVLDNFNGDFNLFEYSDLLREEIDKLLKEEIRAE